MTAKNNSNNDGNMVKINGKYAGDGVSYPTEIIKLFHPILFCGNPDAKPQYSLAAWTNYLGQS
jgi:hypothetical protein